VLQRLPDVTIQHMGSQQDTSIIVGGVQPYETQVLIDGHPLALGQFGVWVSQYYPSYLIGGVETQSGPGNTTPFANIAVGGTVNLLTPAFTKQTTGELTLGIDNYQTQFSHLLTTGSLGKLEYVIGVGADGYNGPFFHTTQCDVTPEGGNTAIIQFLRGLERLVLQQRRGTQTALRVFPATSFEAGFIGAWGGYSPQGTQWGTSLGPRQIVACSGGPADGICTIRKMRT